MNILAKIADSDYRKRNTGYNYLETSICFP